METENAAAAAAAALRHPRNSKEAVLGREPAFWQWRPQALKKWFCLRGLSSLE